MCFKATRMKSVKMRKTVSISITVSLFLVIEQRQRCRSQVTTSTLDSINGSLLIFKQYTLFCVHVRFRSVFTVCSMLFNIVFTK